MNIGAASKLCGLSARMIRHYECIGILPAPARSASGYRRYTPADIDRLCLIRSARTLDFSLREIAELLRLRVQGADGGRQLRQMIESKLQTIAEQTRRLEVAKASLQHLSGCGALESTRAPSLLLGLIDGGHEPESVAACDQTGAASSQRNRGGSR